MRPRVLFSLALCFVSVASGCGKSDNAPAPEAAAQAAPVGTPDQAVRQFLEAVRTGNADATAAMLTDLARKKTAEMDLSVAPAPSPTATFEVGQVEYVTEAKDGAHVATKWTDLDGDGQSRSDEILWVLRLEPQGWRIAGMATKLFEDELPLILNFEEPEDMLRKKQLAEEEMHRRTAEPPLQAKLPPVGGAVER